MQKKSLINLEKIGLNYLEVNIKGNLIQIKQKQEQTIQINSICKLTRFMAPIVLRSRALRPLVLDP